LKAQITPPPPLQFFFFASFPPIFFQCLFSWGRCGLSAFLFFFRSPFPLSLCCEARLLSSINARLKDEFFLFFVLDGCFQAVFFSFCSVLDFPVLIFLQLVCHPKISWLGFFSAPCDFATSFVYRFRLPPFHIGVWFRPPPYWSASLLFHHFFFFTLVLDPFSDGRFLGPGQDASYNVAPWFPPPSVTTWPSQFGPRGKTFLSFLPILIAFLVIFCGLAALYPPAFRFHTDHTCVLTEFRCFLEQFQPLFLLPLDALPRNFPPCNLRKDSRALQAFEVSDQFLVPRYTVFFQFRCFFFFYECDFPLGGTSSFFASFLPALRLRRPTRAAYSKGFPPFFILSFFFFAVCPLSRLSPYAGLMSSDGFHLRKLRHTLDFPPTPFGGPPPQRFSLFLSYRLAIQPVS